jgi:hypothetical protein
VYNISAEVSVGKKRKWSNEIEYLNCLRKYVINMMVKIQFGINRHSKVFVRMITCNRGFIKLVLEAKQFGLSRKGNNSSLVNAKLRAVQNARSTNSLYIRLN